MNRIRVLKVLLVLVGLTLFAGIYPLVIALKDYPHSDVSAGDQMILGIYFPIGIFLALAARNPLANRSLIVCIAWSTLAHDAVMVVQGFQAGTIRGDIPGFGVVALICIALLVLTPAKQPELATPHVTSGWSSRSEAGGGKSLLPTVINSKED
jgi:hypothetical protein